VVHVTDINDHPVIGLHLRAGDSDTRPSTANGEARIKLASQTKPGVFIKLEIVSSPKGHDYVLISPYDKSVQVPPFENEAQNIVSAVVVERRDKACLENSACIRSAAAQIDRATSRHSLAHVPGTKQQRTEALGTVAKDFGLEPEDIDRAIRAWGERVEDPYEKGLAALYEQRIPKQATN